MATNQHRHGDRSGRSVSPTRERNRRESTVSSGPHSAARALRHRLLTESTGTPEEREAEAKRIDEIMAQVKMALDEARAKRDRPDPETPMELATLMVSAMHIVRGIRTIDLCLNGGIKYRLYRTFDHAKREVRDAIKILDKEAGRTLRCKVERMHLARFPQEESARLTALLHLSKELVDRKDMAIWETTVTAMPATLFGVQVLLPRDNMPGISRRGNQAATFVRGGTLPGSQPAQAQGSSPRDASTAAPTGQVAIGQPATGQGGGSKHHAQVQHGTSPGRGCEVSFSQGGHHLAPGVGRPRGASTHSHGARLHGVLQTESSPELYPVHWRE